MGEKLTKAQRLALSDDARFLGGSMFGMMVPGEGRLVFRMVESRPSPRTQAALDELVSAGVVSREPWNQFGGVVYVPLVEFPRAKAPPGAWPITVPITPDLGRQALKDAGR